MSETKVAKEVRKIISKQLCWDLSKVTPEASFDDDLGADSLDQVEILIALETKYGIEIHDDDADRFLVGKATVGEAIAFMERRLTQRSESVTNPNPNES
jgi:acyl carrier protein